MDCPATTPHAHSGEHNCILPKDHAETMALPDHQCECGRRWHDGEPADG